MKLIHLNTFSSGGAFNAVDRLNKSLSIEGLNSSVITQDELEPYFNSKILNNAVISFYWRVVRKYYSFRYKPFAPFFPFFIFKSFYLSQILSQIPSIINLHWVNDFIDYKYFFTNLAGKIPIVWTLHDKNIFLGGFHHELESDIFSEKFANNKPLGDIGRNDIDNKIFLYKKRIFDSVNNTNLCFISPSKSLKERAKQSHLSKFKIEHIPNSIDTQIFIPNDRCESRNQLNLPIHTKILLFCSHKLDNKWKGLDILIKALEKLPTSYLCILIGQKGIIDCKQKNIKFISLTNSEEELTLYYSASDLLINPTLEDNLPNTVLESIACGTPVIGSNVGGIPDMVRNGLTGFLFETGNSEDLARKIELYFSLSEEKRNEMSKNCREIAVKEYSLEVQAKAYIKLYEEILKNWKPINEDYSS